MFSSMDRWSMSTGQAATHAMHVVHSQSVCCAMT